MAEEKLQLGGIDWQETFSFTHVFRSFRLAIHPSKLVLAFVGLALCMIAGLVLDGLWYGGGPIIWNEGSPTEISVFADGGAGGKDFSNWYTARSEAREEQLKRGRKQLGLDADEVGLNSASLANKLIADKEEKLGEWLKSHTLEDKLKGIREKYKDRPEALAEHVKEAKQEIPEARLKKRQDTYREKEEIRDLVGKGPSGRGPFRALMRYEVGVFDNLVSSVGSRNILGGLGMAGVGDDGGVVVQIWRGMKGLQWLLVQHWVYFIIFGSFCLVVWSVFGGAISRTAALHVARGEKISIKEALTFGVKKFPSFLFAPLIPAVIIGVMMVVVGLCSLVGNIPAVGEVLISVLLFLSLIAGFIMALVGVGTVGGLTLMYPTIAVEGSDSFDAISRSFSYVYARPWRMAFYSLVALIYGVLCYLFVRFFAFLVLKMTHVSVGTGIFVKGNSGLIDKLNSMWSAPTLANLYGGFGEGTAWGAQAFGSWVISLWVCVVVGFVAAFLVSFFFSANTVIYTLLRKRVDSTDMDDVYVEEEPEDETPPVTEEPGEGGEVDKSEDKEEPDQSEEEEQSPEDD